MIMNKIIVNFDRKLYKTILTIKDLRIKQRLTTVQFIHQTMTTSKRHKIYITRQINEEAYTLLAKSCEISEWKGTEPVPRSELIQNLASVDGLFCMLTDRIDEEVLLNASPNLQIIATMSVGLDHLDLDAIKKRNIRIGYTPDILTGATAELTIGLLLMTSRRLLEANNEAKTNGWSTWSPFWMCGHNIEGATVGIVGFGRIGQAVAQRLQAFKLGKLLYFSQSRHVEAEQAFNANQVSFDDLLAQSDFVICTCALTSHTKHLFDGRAFAQMRKTAVFINTSRGGVVDQDALVNALKTGQIWAAGLDVTTPEPLPSSHELFSMKNCVILPHIGSATVQTRNNMALLTAQNLLAGMNGDPMPAEFKI